MVETSEFRIPLYDFVHTMATAADLISPVVAQHHTRVAYIAHRIACEIELPAVLRQDLAVAASLHDLGAFSLSERTDLLQFELEKPHQHAELGYLFFCDFVPFAAVARLIRYHHQPWRWGGGAARDGEGVPLASHLLHLADRVDVLSFRCDNILAEAEMIVRQIRGRAGELFVPEQVTAFESLARLESFWLDLRSPGLDEILRASLDAAAIVMDDAGMLHLARLLSQLVDFKSQYTSTHTAGVARCAELIGELYGFDPEHSRKLLLAGYLHDVGKVAIPREILDKPSGLDLAEYGIVKSHPYHTRRILSTIEGMREIAQWAASHHEHVDGSGYPFHISSLPLESRIVAVADVFTALAEDRPYRAGLPVAEVERILRRMAQARKLDSEVVETLLENHATIDSLRREAQASAREHYDEMLERARRFA